MYGPDNTPQATNYLCPEPIGTIVHEACTPTLRADEQRMGLHGSIGYRWANEGFVEGTFYNSFSYLLGFEKRFNDRHSLSFTTWGSPTERAQQGSSTEEAYWLANDHYYNPNWGYQTVKSVMHVW